MRRIILALWLRFSIRAGAHRSQTSRCVSLARRIESTPRAMLWSASRPLREARRQTAGRCITVRSSRRWNPKLATAHGERAAGLDIGSSTPPALSLMLGVKSGCSPPLASRLSGCSGRIVVLSPRDGSIPADVYWKLWNCGSISSFSSCQMTALQP